MDQNTNPLWLQTRRQHLQYHSIPSFSSPGVCTCCVTHNSVVGRTLEHCGVSLDDQPDFWHKVDTHNCHVPLVYLEWFLWCYTSVEMFLSCQHRCSGCWNSLVFQPSGCDVHAYIIGCKASGFWLVGKQHRTRAADVQYSIWPKVAPKPIYKARLFYFGGKHIYQ